jgi:hypothetical protein
MAVTVLLNRRAWVLRPIADGFALRYRRLEWHL